MVSNSMNLEMSLLQIPMDANWALLVATMILVIVTIFYAIQTYKLVNVPFRPALLVRLTYSTSGKKSSVEVRTSQL